MGRHRGPVNRGKYYQALRAEKKALPDAMLEALVRQKYHIVGEHSAAKLCHWARLSLEGKGECYKSRFYGISSHRCLQCTPVLLFCNHSCVFCWRMMPEKKASGPDLPRGGFDWDPPEKVIDGLVQAQKEIMSGFGGNPKVERQRFLESSLPKHAALSLTGEPTMYPHMEGLLIGLRKRGMTTFLVTNGTFPERIAKWKEFPTQLYVSMVAPNEEVYRKSIRPSSQGLWRKYWKTLRMLPGIGAKTRTVLRMTLARGVNDSDLEGYARQINAAKPHYVEVKSMVFVGGARKPSRGLTPTSMLENWEIEKIAEELCRLTGYIKSDAHGPSRVALLCRDRKAEEKRKILWQ